MIEVLEPGLLTTVQDLGRPGHGHLGVPPAGAADPWSLRVANLLAGNPPDAATLEITAAGPRLRSTRPLRVGLAGADLHATVAGRAAQPGEAVELEAGAELSLPGPPASGFRAYAAFAGGLDVPVVLGSRSTSLPGAFGGLAGRALRAGDRLRVAPADGAAADTAVVPGASSLPSMPPRTIADDGAVVLRCLPGPAGDTAVTTHAWTVSPSSDRMGVRLEGDAIARTALSVLPSHGVVPGTVQVPPDGRPILLGVDHQTTGGYPVAAVVIAADLAAIGQLAPGDRLRLAVVTQREARLAWTTQRRAWLRAVRAFRRDAGWDQLWRSAGA